MKMRYIALSAAALAAIPFALGADAPDAGTANPTMPAAMPLPAQPGAAPTNVFVPNAPATPTATAPTPTSATKATATTDPKVGDSASTALLTLGRPSGQFDLPDEVIYMFDRGRIVVSSNGIVKEVDLKPVAEFQAIQAADAQQQAEQQSAEQKKRTTANAMLQLLLSDPTYVALSTRDRLLALKQFDRDHPGSDEPQAYKDLLAIYQTELSVDKHATDLQNQNKQAMSQTSVLQKQLADDEKALAALKARTTQAEQQAIQATMQPAVNAVPAPEQVLQPLPNSNPAPQVNYAGPVGKSGAGGSMAITPGSGVMGTPPAPSKVDVNGTLQSPPAGSYWVMQPDGTLKLVSPSP
ncbi:MAG TPA: hypothetical protein VK737_04730 [Opitutales bacterium]|jgi:hypothetical protein|nr:hypothetical protein [Opitutales bacterium]